MIYFIDINVIIINPIKILNKYDIDYLKYNNISSLIYEIEEILNEEYNEELDKVSGELAEFNYYNNTNK